MNSKDQETTEKVRNWWSTEIIDMRPGKIRIRGEDIEELIGNISFVQMIWLMLHGKLPSVEEASLLEAALVASVDHGPQAPAIAAARMTVSRAWAKLSAVSTHRRWLLYPPQRNTNLQAAGRLPKTILIYVFVLYLWASYTTP